MINDKKKTIITDFKVILLLLVYFFIFYTMTPHADSNEIILLPNHQDKNKIQKCSLEIIGTSKDVTHTDKTFTIKVFGLLNKDYKTPTISNITATAESKTVSVLQNDTSSKNIAKK